MTPGCVHQRLDGTVILEKLIVSQLIRKFSAFYGTVKFIRTFATVCHSFPVLQYFNPVYLQPSSFWNIQFDIILPSTRRSSKCSLSCLFPHQNTVWTFPLPYMCLILPGFFTRITSAESINALSWQINLHVIYKLAAPQKITSRSDKVQQKLRNTWLLSCLSGLVSFRRFAFCVSCAVFKTFFELLSKIP